MNNKNNQINEVKNLGKLPVWNLRDLYISKTDKNLTKDLNIIKSESSKFEKKYINNIKKLNAEELFKAITKLEEIDILMDRFYLMHTY